MFDAAKMVDAALDNPFTEDALALRFSTQYADTLRYIATKAQWQSWDGERWYDEHTHLAFHLARECCRVAAHDCCNGKPINNILNAKTFAAVERMAKTDRRQATIIEQWDANDLLFNSKKEQ
jgi:putative DNA primase/helicase